MILLEIEQMMGVGSYMSWITSGYCAREWVRLVILFLLVSCLWCGIRRRNEEDWNWCYVGYLIWLLVWLRLFILLWLVDPVIWMAFLFVFFLRWHNFDKLFLISNQNGGFTRSFGFANKNFSIKYPSTFDMIVTFIFQCFRK